MTPEEQKAAAEAARAEGDKNPKADPKEEIAALEQQIAVLKEKQKSLVASPEPMAGSKTTLQKPSPQSGTGTAPNVPSTTTSP